jgi:glycolate oxidase FAD binding subunit
MGLGMPPARYDLALETTALDYVLEYEPADLTVSVEAGMRLGELQRRLGENGQWLPLDPPAGETATIGGILAVNASGPARAPYGTSRDLLIGITVAGPDGRLFKSGGRVVKNVAGYDLGKLQIGAIGTLGVITRASFKVAPLPAETRGVEARSADPRPLISLAGSVRREGLAVNGLALNLTPDGHEWRLLLRFAGGAAAVEASLRRVDALARESGVTLAEADAATWRDLMALPFQDQMSVRASVIPSTVAEMIERFGKLGAAVVAYPTAGIVYGAWRANDVLSAALLELRRHCQESGRGALVIETAPLELKRHVDVWGPARGDIAIMRRLKEQFDPQSTLNPGRYLAGI